MGRDQELWSVETEQALIGAVLLDPVEADLTLPEVPSAAFHREIHRAIWMAIATLRSGHTIADPVTVADALRRAGIPCEVTYLSDCCLACPATAAAAEYARTVRDLAARRNVYQTLRAAIRMAADQSIALDDLRDTLQGGVRSLADMLSAGAEADTLEHLAIQAYTDAESVWNGSRTPGLSTGMPGLDRQLGGGLHRQELTVLAGRPSAGKSALAQQWAVEVARRNGRVYFASLEMHSGMVGTRALAAEAGIDSARLRGSPPLHPGDWTILSNAIGRMGRYGGRVLVDSSSRTMDRVISRVRAVHARDRVDLVVIDYLQRCRTPGHAADRNRALGEAARGAKDLAMDLDCAVLLLSQLNRAAAAGGREPALHDLRDTGELEQEADTVLILHRPDDGAPPAVVSLRLLVPKQRQGSAGMRWSIYHERATGRFTEPAPPADHRSGEPREGATVGA